MQHTVEISIVDSLSMRQTHTSKVCSLHTHIYLRDSLSSLGSVSSADSTIALCETPLLFMYAVLLVSVGLQELIYQADLA